MTAPAAFLNELRAVYGAKPITLQDYEREWIAEQHAAGKCESWIEENWPRARAKYLRMYGS